MKIKVEQNDLICNLRYMRLCDYVFSYTEWLENGKKCIIIKNNFDDLILRINMDNRKTITVYLKYDDIIIFFNYCKFIKKNIILITGCSDYSINENIYIKKPKNILKWYGENVNYKDVNLIPLPMGSLSATWIGNNIFDAEIYNHKDFKLITIDDINPKIINLAFMCFNIETNKDHRGKVYEYFDNKYWVTNLCSKKTQKYLNDDIFINMCYNHKFVISPFGNGIDCGRTYMSLQVGTIPIIPYHICFEEFEKHLPIILFKDINDITEDFLLKKYDELKKKNFNYNYIKNSFWKQKWNDDKEEFNQLI
jgi:hypothetical protein